MLAGRLIAYILALARFFRAPKTPGSHAGRRRRRRRPLRAMCRAMQAPVCDGRRERTRRGDYISLFMFRWTIMSCTLRMVLSRREVSVAFVKWR